MSTAATAAGSAVSAVRAATPRNGTVDDATAAVIRAAQVRFSVAEARADRAEEALHATEALAVELAARIEEAKGGSGSDPAAQVEPVIKAALVRVRVAEEKAEKLQERVSQLEMELAAATGAPVAGAERAVRVRLEPAGGGMVHCLIAAAA